MQRFNPDFDSTQVEGVTNYFRERARQLQHLHYHLKIVSFHAWGQVALWQSNLGKMFASPYIYHDHRKDHKYLTVCEQLPFEILTVDDCNLASYLRKFRMDATVAKMRVAYNTVTSYYGNRRSVTTNCHYMEHIEDGLAVLADYNADVDLLDAFCYHPIYQSNAKELIEQIEAYADSGVINLCRKYAKAANSYRPADTEKSPPQVPEGSLKMLLLADKVANYRAFEKHEDKFSVEHAAQLHIYFKKWLQALDLDYEEYSNMSRSLDIDVLV